MPVSHVAWEIYTQLYRDARRAQNRPLWRFLVLGIHLYHYTRSRPSTGKYGLYRGITGKVSHHDKIGGFSGVNMVKTGILKTRKNRVRFSGNFAPRGIFARAGVRGISKVAKVVNPRKSQTRKSRSLVAKQNHTDSRPQNRNHDTQSESPSGNSSYFASIVARSLLESC